MAAFVKWWVLDICFLSSITILYSLSFFFLSWSMYTQIYSGRKLQFCLSFWCLSVSPRGMLLQKRRAYGSKCCEISIEYSFILYIWCSHLSHLLGLSHLNEKEWINTCNNEYFFPDYMKSKMFSALSMVLCFTTSYGTYLVLEPLNTPLDAPNCC